MASDADVRSFRGETISCEGTRAIQRGQPIRLTVMVAGVRAATASAKPSACASIPARPSETTHMRKGCDTTGVKPKSAAADQTHSTFKIS